MSVITKLEQESAIDQHKDLLKKTVGAGLTDLEFDLFVNICKHTDLNPFIKQIYPVKIQGKLNIITGIDGLRSIAERTGNYSPGREPSFQYDKEGIIICATAHVKKRTPDGTWHEVSATAFLSEYKPAHGGGSFWRDKPHIMIAKCAEALAIRRAFPSVTANLYTKDEMEQAEPMMEMFSETREAPKVQPYPSSPKKMQPEEKETASEAISVGKPFQNLKSSLEAEGIDTARLEEWVFLRCQSRGQSPDDTFRECNNRFQKFKESFVKWSENVPT